jgi:hypothetical protein
MAMIEPGFNSDVMHAGRTYHVQTEDWGEQNPFVVTRVYSSGMVVVSIKSSYDEITHQNHAVGRQAVRLGMREQHQRVLDQLVSGHLLRPSIK